MAHDLNFKEVTVIFKVGSTDVFVHKRKKSYQTLSMSKIPTFSLWRDPLPGSHILLKTLKGVSSQRQLMKRGGLIDFWPDLAHPFGRFGRTKRWDGRKDFAQGRWWGGILWDVNFLCIKTASGRALLFSFRVLLLHAKHDQCLLKEWFNLVSTIWNIFVLSNRPRLHFPSLYITNIPTWVVWGMKRRDWFNI